MSVTTVKTTTRDVAADLIGGMPAKSKTKFKDIMGIRASLAKAGIDSTPRVTKASVLAKVKGALSPEQQKAAKKIIDGNGSKGDKIKKLAVLVKGKKVVSAPRSEYEDSAKIKVVKERDVREGTSIAKAWEIVKKSKTIGALVANRKKAKLGDGLGGYFPIFVREKNVRVSV